VRTTEISTADADRAVDLICAMIDEAREAFSSEASWERLAQFFYEQLMRETVLRSTIIVAWAEAGHPAAHRAIHRYGREMGERSRFDQMLVTVRSYYLRTAEQPFKPFPHGRHIVQNLLRDIWVPSVVQRFADGTGVPATRSRSTRSASAAYFVSLALKRRGIKLKEQQINRLYWARHKIVAELEASMPEIAIASLTPCSRASSIRN
jgi:hypothetical protein